MAKKSFSELYCSQNGIEPARYEREVLLRSLYPHTRLVAWYLLLTNSDVLTADFDFVRSVGDLRRFRDFDFEAQEYAHHPGNRGFWREYCYVRVSVGALRRMVRDTLHPSLTSSPDESGTSAAPFPQDQTPEGTPTKKVG